LGKSFENPEVLWILVSMTGIFSLSYRKSATPNKSFLGPSINPRKYLPYHPYRSDILVDNIFSSVLSLYFLLGQ
jgi:hypothetical protein